MAGEYDTLDSDDYKQEALATLQRRIDFAMREYVNNRKDWSAVLRATMACVIRVSREAGVRWSDIEQITTLDKQTAKRLARSSHPNHRDAR